MSIEPVPMKDISDPGHQACVDLRFDHDLRSDYGLVSPDGIFYACDHYGHGDLGYRLDAWGKGGLKPGWIHVSGDEWYMDNKTEVSQAQIDCAHDWCQAAPSWRKFNAVMHGLGL